jgi:hypothetical protein
VAIIPTFWMAASKVRDTAQILISSMKQLELRNIIVAHKNLENLRSLLIELQAASFSSSFSMHCNEELFFSLLPK